MYTIILESKKQLSRSTYSDTYERSSQSTDSFISLNNQQETSLASSVDELDIVSQTLQVRTAAPRQTSDRVRISVEDLTQVDDLLIRHIGAH